MRFRAFFESMNLSEIDKKLHFLYRMRNFVTSNEKFTIYNFADNNKYVLMRPLDVALVIYNRIIVKNISFSRKKGVAKLDNRRASSL